jgi:haloalkane dehalogenase
MVASIARASLWRSCSTVGVITDLSEVFLFTTSFGRTEAMVSAAFPFQKQRVEVNGLSQAYVDVGQGDPIVLLHGNPTSSYLWRNIIPYLQELGRCIAPDLIGMGDSDKLPKSGPASYTFVEHRGYLDTLLEQLDVRERVTFAIHDWGSALGFDWASRHPDAVKGIAYMEALVRPLTWDDFHPQIRPAFEALRSPAGEQLVLDQNMFVEQIFPGAIFRKLTGEEMTEYRRPFAEPGEARRPTLTWPREIPIDGQPADVAEIIRAYGDWLSQSSVPKLFVKGEPGALLASGPSVKFCRSWPSQSESSVRGVHFLQEDSRDEIGYAIAEWLMGLTA